MLWIAAHCVLRCQNNKGVRSSERAPDVKLRGGPVQPSQPIFLQPVLLVEMLVIKMLESGLLLGSCCLQSITRRIDMSSGS